MSSSSAEHLSKVWRDNLFGKLYTRQRCDSCSFIADGRVVFCTGGSGTICSAQVKALVQLGANACVVGRNAEKTERVARAIAEVRTGSKVIGIGNIDVRKLEALESAVRECVRELGSIDFVM